MNYDTIEEIEKGVDAVEVVEVEKFNPFHDARGRFSDKNGFSSYSANPNTRAGAMAIARSQAAGHGNTANVHRHSYGETIQQNASWMGRGAKTHVGGTVRNGAASLRNKEKFYGLAGASATGADWQNQNMQRGRKTGPAKQPQQQAQQAQQAPQKPAAAQQTKPQAAQQKPQQAQQQPAQQQQQASQTLASKVAGTYLSSGDKLAIQQRDYNGHTTTNSKNVAKAHDQDRVAGQDISKTVDVRKIRGNKEAIDKIVEQQGWNKAPTVTDDFETFQKAAKKSGCVLIRSVGNNRYTGQSADDVCRDTMTDGNASLGGTGAKVYGTGLYMVKTDFGSSTGRNLAHKIQRGQSEAYSYGNKQMMATIHPDAKIATPTQANKMKRDFYSLSSSDQKKYGDWGGYIAAKGYDGAQWHASSDPTAYSTIYNKSALIFYSGVSDR